MKASELRALLDQAHSICGSDPDVVIGDQQDGAMGPEHAITEVDISVCIGKVVVWS